jgi:dolichol-phosphate mannosyltransferase
MAQAPRPLIIVSTYNEKENIEALVSEILTNAPEVNVLVVDDNSPDGTGALVREMMKTEPRLKILARPGKLGLGTAILDGIKVGLAEGYDPICTMDADFSHHPKYLPAILRGTQQYDVMIGSRYVDGGGTKNWGLGRRILSKGSNLTSRILLGFPANDCTGCYRAYRSDLLRRIDRDSVKSSGYSFVEEILELCYRAGATMGETPIVFEDRRAGKSKISRKEIVRAVMTLFRLRWQRMTGGAKRA